MRAKCPKCERIIASADIDNFDLNGGGYTYVGVAYSCPLCHSVLSVSMDQLALNADLVQKLLTALGRG